MKNKGFTLTELLAVIVIISIIGVTAVISVSYITNTGKKGIYKNYESNLKGASEAYLIQNIDEIPKPGSSKKITYNMLINGYMKKMEDPNGGLCDGYVIVTRGADIGNNYDLDYMVCLECSNYTSDDC